MKVPVRRGRIDPAVTATQTVVPLVQQDVVSEEELNSHAELLRDDDILRNAVLETGLAEQGRWCTYCRSYFTPDITEHNGIRIVRLPTIRTKHLDALVHTFLSTVHACFGRCDLVHYQTLGPALFSFLPRLLREKTVVMVQGLDWKR